MIWHLYILWCDHHEKSNNHLLPYKVLMILLLMFPMLSITFPWLLIPLHHFYPPPSPGNLQCVLCIYECFYFIFFCLFTSFRGFLFCFFFFLDSTFKRNHTVFIFLWLISLSLTSSSRCIHVVANGKILCIFILGPLFHCIYICVCVSHLLYAFFCWWTPQLLSYFSYCR